MNKVRYTVLLYLAFWGSFQLAFGQSPKAVQLDDYIKPFAKASHFSGVVLASENGKVIYEKAFGLANADYRIPNQLDTRIGIASITKPMTLVILIRLIEEKKIAWDHKLSQYIPDLPGGDRITIEMLARHRSGIPHRVMPPELEAVSYTTEEFVEKVRQAKLAFEPGTQRLYSSAGYAVLARILEIAAGKSYARLLQEYVFSPADMTDSVEFDARMIMERRAQDYFLTPDGIVNAPLKDYSFLVGAGSVFSTARDVYRFGNAVLDGTYGETLKSDLIGEGTIRGSGRTNGHRAYFEIELEKRYGYVVLSNLSSGAFDIISRGVAEILQGKEPTVKNFAVPVIIPNPNGSLEEFLGKYGRSDGGGEIEIVLKNGYLQSGDIRLYPTRPDCFFDYVFFGEVCFIRSDSGKIQEIKWKGADFDLTWIKQ